MGWQADRSSRSGGGSGREEGLPELFAGFGQGGAWDAAVPSASLAAALEAAAGPEGLYEGADVDALFGIVRQWAAIESWAGAGLLGTLRAMTREDREGRRRRRRNDLPDGWDDSLNYEVAAALAMGPVSAGNLAGLAWTLGTRLPGVGQLLADGTLTRAKAKLIAATFEPLDEGEAARAEALILAELAGKTYFQVERLAWRAALAVAPDVAERRRKQAEQERARVTVFREESGAVGLSGRDLPAAQALSGHANVLARAKEYEASGAFPGETAGRLEALAYLHLLNGVTAADAVAFARTADMQPPDDAGRDHDRDDADSRDGQAATTEPPGATDQGESNADEAGSAAGSCGTENRSRGHEPNGDDSADDPGNDEGPDDEGSGNDGGNPGGGPRPGGSRGHKPNGDDSADDPGNDEGPDGDGRNPNGGRGPGDNGGGPRPDGSGSGPGGPGRAGGRVALPEVTVPLATLQGRAERPGDNRLLGPLDPAMARDLAAAAARSPYSRWEVIVVDVQGYAVGHGIARARHSGRRKPQPSDPACCAFPARVNITVTEALLRQLPAQPRSGAPPGGWELVPGTAKNGDDAWILTLPGGRELIVRLDSVPTHECDHRYQVGSYQPSDRLRRLIQVRDRECTFPTCSRPACDSDFEHAQPYDQGGRTDACNTGARSRRCHQVKQTPGWRVTQPKPGWHVWTTPAGRIYVQPPWRYTA
jgi:Domain of unknown function (DUF222)